MELSTVVLPHMSDEMLLRGRIAAVSGSERLPHPELELPIRGQCILRASFASLMDKALAVRDLNHFE